MSANVLTDLDQRRKELGAELQSCIQENVMHKRRAEEIARHKTELTQNLTRMRITCAEVNANVQDLEERKKSLEAIIEAENSRVAAAREELDEAEKNVLEARKSCKKAFELAVTDVSKCYRVECNKDFLKKEIFDTNDRITSLKRQMLLVQASTFALVNQAHIDGGDSSMTSCEMIDATNATDEEKYLEQLENKAKTLQKELDGLNEQLLNLEKEKSSVLDDNSSLVFKEPRSIEDILELTDRFDPATSSPEETVRLTELLSNNLLTFLTPMLEGMYGDVETGVKNATIGTDIQVALEQIYCSKAMDEVLCNSSILASFGGTCQKLLGRIDSTSQLATRLLGAPLEMINEELMQIESQQQQEQQ